MDDSHISGSEVGCLFGCAVEEGEIEMASEWKNKLNAVSAAQSSGVLVFEGLDRRALKHIQVCAESLPVTTLERSN